MFRVSRRRLFLAGALFTFLGLGHWFSLSHHNRIADATARRAIVSLASSQHRLDRELPITLRSLVAQSVPPREIRLYLPEADREAFERRPDSEPALLHPLVKVLFVEDVGPATKFVPVLRDLLQQADAGDGDALDTPVIIVDDDHSYTPALVETLLKSHCIYPNASVGFRGWRVREDLSWGVAWDEVDRHVIAGYRLATPYRVGVLTANEGYLVLPRFFLPPASTPPLAHAAPLLDGPSLARTPAHLVDDIWMAGSLAVARVPRLVVPLPAPPSADVTVVHTLETHMAAAGMDRGAANNAALGLFADAWRAEGLWYRFAADVRGAKGVVFDKNADEPVMARSLERTWKEVGRWWREQMVKAGIW